MKHDQRTLRLLQCCVSLYPQHYSTLYCIHRFCIVLCIKLTLPPVWAPAVYGGGWGGDRRKEQAREKGEVKSKEAEHELK